jgi:subtilisin family serine protease
LVLLALAPASAWQPTLPAQAGSAEQAAPDSRATAKLGSRLRERARQLARLGADQWHKAGYRGRGIKVAVLDSGFRGYRDFLGNALPAKVTARSFRRDGNLEAKDSQHGILCGEVIHAVAPQAELLFANWEPDRPDQFLDAVRWARQQGAQIISCSIIMPSWSDGEGGGKIHADLARILGTGDRGGDLLCFASAGNTAQRHWSGAFHDGGDGRHEWQPGHMDNSLTPWGSEPVSAEIYWQPGAEYELTVRDVDTGRAVGASAGRLNGERCSAVVRFQPQTYHHYQVQVRLTHGPAGRFHLAALAAGLEYSLAPGSISFPADGPEVIAVGAVDYDGHRQTYSSCGPNSERPKPDVVAPVPFPSQWRAQPFAGTSAAAPQAAAVAALWWSRHPEWRAERVRKALVQTAYDLGPPGHDCETGYGRIHLP